MERFDISEDLKQEFAKAYLQQPPRAERAKWLEDNKGLACTNCRRKGIKCVPQSGPRAGAGCVACLHRGGHEPVCSRLLEERKARVISKLRISESKYIVLRKWFEDEKQVTATAKKAKNKAAAAAAEQSNSSSTAATPSSSASTVLASTRNNSNARVQTRSTSTFEPAKSTHSLEEPQDAASDSSPEPPSRDDFHVDIDPPEPEQTSVSLEAEIAKLIEENQCMIDKCDELLRPARRVL
ncbi:rRNA-processing protein EBP2 [Stygiomarasmius scandens]|uniref:rRNA-processing protein EBP2 n=1 Tax=Marasmiellus scandens TaxID=2682957 RepID=A0ABR1JLM4_9AGAR